MLLVLLEYMPIVNEESSKPEKLDKKDLAIIDILKNNSRETCQKIAKKVSLSNDAVGYRIKRLENLGVISGYKLKLHYPFTNHQEFILFFGLLEDNTKKIDALDSHLKKIDHVKEIMHYSDKWDTKVQLIAENIGELDELASDISDKYSNIIIDYEILTIVKDLIHKETKKCAEVEKTKLDEKDEKIIKILEKNSRESIVSIAKKLNMNADTVMYHLNKITQSGIIKKFSAIPNLNKLGLHLYTAMIIMKDFGDKEEKKLREFCETNSNNILSAHKTVGHWNVIMDISAKDQKEFQSVMQKLKMTLENSLKDYDVIMAYKEIDK